MLSLLFRYVLVHTERRKKIISKWAFMHENLVNRSFAIMVFAGTISACQIRNVVWQIQLTSTSDKLVSGAEFAALNS